MCLLTEVVFRGVWKGGRLVVLVKVGRYCSGTYVLRMGDAWRALLMRAT